MPKVPEPTLDRIFDTARILQESPKSDFAQERLRLDVKLQKITEESEVSCVSIILWFVARLVLALSIWARQKFQIQLAHTCTHYLVKLRDLRLPELAQEAYFEVNRMQANPVFTRFHWKLTFWEKHSYMNWLGNSRGVFEVHLAVASQLQCLV